MLARKIRSILMLASLTVTVLAGCAAVDPSRDGAEETDDGTSDEAALSDAEKNAICDAIPQGQWTQAQSDKLLSETATRFRDLKRQNDALIAQRGVGAYAGVKSSVWKAIAANDKNQAVALIQSKVKPGFDARAIVDSIRATSCIGAVYTVLREVYASLGKQSEWAAVEKCGRAWDSVGTRVQQALIKNGWPAPTLGFVNDALDLPGPDSEVAIHQEFLRSVPRGSYYGTPVSKTKLMKDFLPSPGSATPRDEALFLRLGSSRTLGFSILRAGFHVPLIVPASVIAEDLAPSGPTRAAWLASRSRGEPFVLESHSLRQPWDPTNFEIRPMKEVMSETFDDSVTYATGIILFSPLSQSPLN